MRMRNDDYESQSQEKNNQSGFSEPIMFFLRDTVTVFSMIPQISKTYIDDWKLNNKGFFL